MKEESGIDKFNLSSICKIAFNNPMVVLNGGKQGSQGRRGKGIAENMVRFFPSLVEAN